VKFNNDGTVSLMAEPLANRRRNIAQGFYDATGFHPIRASADYDPDRLFDPEYEPTGRSRRRKKKPKAKAKRRRR
jgi:hypothetical protein